MLSPYIHKKEDSEHLKIKWTDAQREERFLIKDISID